MWWRILIPTWRFFDSVGISPELLVFSDNAWRPFLARPKLHWYSLFFNPRGNFYHAYNNLLERLIVEMADGGDPAQLVSFALIKDLVGDLEFRILVDGKEVLHRQRLEKTP